MSKKGFDVEDGPFIKELEKTLAGLNVHRQAYYGGTFIGNHAHKCLKVCTVENKTVKTIITALNTNVFNYRL